MTTIEHERVEGRPRSLPRRVSELVLAHPVLTVLLVALAVRLLVAGLLLATGRWPLAPDEQQYVDLARTVAAGRPAADYERGWGSALLEQTATYVLPVTALFKAFGPYVFIAQAVSALAGALTAALTCRLALLALPVRYALLAGAITALLPSQVLWSSLVLRESSVWLSLVALALLLSVAATTAQWSRLAACALGAGVALLALAHLRPYVFIVACWAFALAAVLCGARRAAATSVTAVSLAVLLPLLVGLGPGGLTLVGQTLPVVARLQQQLAVGADSAIVAPPPPPPTRGPAGPTTAPPAPTDDEPTAATGGSRLSGIPRGLVSVTLRPFVWEGTASTASTFAKAENLVWVLLYALAAAGTWAGRRQRWLVAFPVIFSVGFVLMSALFEGNLGTAFRHRGQITWALALLAALGAAHVTAMRRGSGLVDTDSGNSASTGS